MPKCMRDIVCFLMLVFILPSAWAFEIERVSESSAGDQGNNWSWWPSISADGRFVAFESYADNLVTGDSNNYSDVFVHDRVTGLIELVSVSSTGIQGNHASFFPSISADGRFVVFVSIASNLVLGDANNTREVFVHDRDTGITELVSVSSTGEQGNRESSFPSISGDGRFVAFESPANNLVENDANNKFDVFVHDRDTGTTERVSVSSAGDAGNSNSYRPSISADGRFIAFQSYAKNLVVDDTNDTGDIFVHDRTTGLTERVSTSAIGVQANNYSVNPSVSSGGRYVAFGSAADNLVLGDTNAHLDIFVHDRDTGLTERVSVSSSGEQTNNYYSRYPSVSADGRFVTYESGASNLVAGDTNGYWDIFVHDRDTGITERTSVSTNADQANSHSAKASISADGKYLVFRSGASTLVAGDTNAKNDVFVSENNLLNLANDLSVSLRSTSGAVTVGEKLQFRARLTNTTNQTLNNCKVVIINPRVNGQREFGFFSWPLNVANPTVNGHIDIEPGATGQFILAVSPKVAMRKEVRFNYICDSTQAYSLPFLNSVHLTAKTEPLISEDFVELMNAYPKTQLVIDRANGKYWTGYTVTVSNTGSQSTRINLSTSSDLVTVPISIRQPRLCEPVDPTSGDWSCLTPRAEQLQVDLAAGESKKIRVFVHVTGAIEQKPVKHRVFVQAQDQAGEIVAVTSMGISTIN